MSYDINCVYSIDDGGYCTKHSNAFYDAACNLLDGKPCEDQKPVAEPCNNLSKPFKTNADKIRAMSDEELAGWIDEFWSAAWCPDDPPVDPETKRCLLHDGDCRLCILDWLRQEGE